MDSTLYLSKYNSLKSYVEKEELLAQVLKAENEDRSLFAEERRSNWDVSGLDDPSSKLIPCFSEDDGAALFRERKAFPEENGLPRLFLSGHHSDVTKDKSPVTVSSLEEFQHNFEELFCFNLLSELDWSNVIAAGGSVSGCLQVLPKSLDGINAKRTYLESIFPSGDIDLFIYGLTPEEANEKVKSIYKMLCRACPFQTICFRGANAVTMVSQHPFRHIQVVLRLYSCQYEVIAGFDVDSCAVLYDGDNVFCTPRSHYALTSRLNTVDMSRRSPSYETRLAKYGARGFACHVPLHHPENVDPNIYDKPFNQLRGLQLLLVLDKLQSPAERIEYQTRHDAKRAPRMDLRSEAAGRLKALEGLLETSASASDYTTVFLPWAPGITAWNCVTIMKTKDKQLNSAFFAKDRTYRLHPCFFGTAKEIIDDCSPDDPPIPPTVDPNELKNYVRGPLVHAWKQHDPGAQQIGSFNPITVGDWTIGAYVRASTGKLFEAVNRNDVEALEALLGANEPFSNDFVFQRDYLGRSPVHLGIMAGANDCVALLLECGATDPALCDPRGRNALHLCAEYNAPGLARVTIDALRRAEQEFEDHIAVTTSIADSSKQPRQIRLSTEVSKLTVVSSATPLQVALRLGHVDVAKVLVEQGGVDPCDKVIVELDDKDEHFAAIQNNLMGLVTREIGDLGISQAETNSENDDSASDYSEEDDSEDESDEYSAVGDMVKNYTHEEEGLLSAKRRLMNIACGSYWNPRCGKEEVMALGFANSDELPRFSDDSRYNSRSNNYALVSSLLILPTQDQANLVDLVKLVLGTSDVKGAMMNGFNSVFHVAAATGNAPLLSVLADLVLSGKSPDLGNLVVQLNYKGKLAIHVAIDAGHLECAQILYKLRPILLPSKDEISAWQQQVERGGDFSPLGWCNRPQSPSSISEHPGLGVVKEITKLVTDRAKTLLEDKKFRAAAFYFDEWSPEAAAKAAQELHEKEKLSKVTHLIESGLEMISWLAHSTLPSLSSVPCSLQFFKQIILPWQNMIKSHEPLDKVLVSRYGKPSERLGAILEATVRFLETTVEKDSYGDDDHVQEAKLLAVSRLRCARLGQAYTECASLPLDQFQQFLNGVLSQAQNRLSRQYLLRRENRPTFDLTIRIRQWFVNEFRLKVLAICQALQNGNGNSSKRASLPQRMRRSLSPRSAQSSSSSSFKDFARATASLKALADVPPRAAENNPEQQQQQEDSAVLSTWLGHDPQRARRRGKDAEDQYDQEKIAWVKGTQERGFLWPYQNNPCLWWEYAEKTGLVPTVRSFITSFSTVPLLTKDFGSQALRLPPTGQAMCARAFSAAFQADAAGIRAIAQDPQLGIPLAAVQAPLKINLVAAVLLSKETEIEGALDAALEAMRPKQLGVNWYSDMTSEPLAKGFHISRHCSRRVLGRDAEKVLVPIDFAHALCPNILESYEEAMKNCKIETDGLAFYEMHVLELTVLRDDTALLRCILAHAIALAEPIELLDDDAKEDEDEDDAASNKLFNNGFKWAWPAFELAIKMDRPQLVQIFLEMAYDVLPWETAAKSQCITGGLDFERGENHSDEKRKSRPRHSDSSKSYKGKTNPEWCTTDDSKSTFKGQETSCRKFTRDVWKNDPLFRRARRIPVRQPKTLVRRAAQLGAVETFSWLMQGPKALAPVMTKAMENATKVAFPLEQLSQAMLERAEDLPLAALTTFSGDETAPEYLAALTLVSTTNLLLLEPLQGSLMYEIVKSDSHLVLRRALAELVTNDQQQATVNAPCIGQGAGRRSPLAIAALNGQIEMTAELLRHGADPCAPICGIQASPQDLVLLLGDDQDDHGHSQSNLLAALLQDDDLTQDRLFAIVELITTICGKDVLERALLQRNATGLTPLMIAFSHRRQVPVIKNLFEQCFSQKLFAVKDHCQQTLLHIEAQRVAREKATKFILEWMPEQTLLTEDSYGFTPIDLAQQQNIAGLAPHQSPPEPFIALTNAPDTASRTRHLVELDKVIERVMRRFPLAGSKDALYFNQLLEDYSALGKESSPTGAYSGLKLLTTNPIFYPFTKTNLPTE